MCYVIQHKDMSLLQRGAESLRVATARLRLPTRRSSAEVRTQSGIGKRMSDEQARWYLNAAETVRSEGVTPVTLDNVDVASTDGRMIDPQRPTNAQLRGFDYDGQRWTVVEREKYWAGDHNTYNRLESVIVEGLPIEKGPLGLMEEPQRRPMVVGLEVGPGKEPGTAVAYKAHIFTGSTPRRQ